MHLSMHNWMRAEPIEVTVARLAKFGYESIEISGEPYTYDTKHVRGVLKEHGIRCWGSVTLMLGERNLVAKDEGIRAKSVQYVKDCVTMVKELDGYEMTIVPATVGKINSDGNPEEEWEWAVSSMREIYGHALKEGVKLAIEPINRFETYFVSRAAQALELAKATGPECGVCLDAFHLNIEEVDPYESIISAKGRLVDFHVADTNRFACGQGHADWLKIVGTLKTIGYDGALTVEFVAPIDRTPANPYPDAVETEPVDISPEQLKFIEEHGSSVLTEEFYSWQVETCAKTLLPLIS
ncbi:MAG TPA: sugar phosphate isomerase/epimerase [candidate division Zixibacteria bacterium]|jgi:sugar phosphate isomerase/epimerase|nr:sugar phosphate isomerase/epimerase [candidate division Zixibacteria bacterium]